MRFEQLCERLSLFGQRKPTLDEALLFLAQAVTDDVPIYVAGASGFFLYTVLVPSDQLAGDYVADLMQWNFTVPSGWGYGYSLHSRDVAFFISPPLDETGSHILDNGEPTFFWRDFIGHGSYFEISQKLAHVLDIHLCLDGNRRLYQRVNENGDFENIAIAYRDDDAIICTLKHSDFELYRFLVDAVAIRVFDILLPSKELRKNFDNRSVIRKVTPLGDEIFYRGGSLPIADGCYIRGFQVLNFKTSQAELGKVAQGEREREYATFLTLDWKHNEVRECSCDPDHLGNYFVESDMPYEISPAFFRPDVLLKYQQDPDKYRIETRRIYCRGVWDMRYDINEHGQVHVYLKDLAYLPYGEQLYWKSFNEEPESGISARAFAHDFEGKWVAFEDPLVALKKILTNFPNVEIGGNQETIWDIHTDSFERLNYVHTGARKEWEDQILNLTKLLVDGLKKKPIKRTAKALGCYDANLGSIKLLGQCLLTYGTDPEVVESIVSTLGELWATRNHIAHPGKLAQLKYKEHFDELIERSLDVMETITELIGGGFPGI